MLAILLAVTVVMRACHERFPFRMLAAFCSLLLVRVLSRKGRGLYGSGVAGFLRGGGSSVGVWCCPAGRQLPDISPFFFSLPSLFQFLKGESVVGFFCSVNDKQQDNSTQFLFTADSILQAGF